MADCQGTSKPFGDTLLKLISGHLAEPEYVDILQEEKACVDFEAIQREFDVTLERNGMA